MIADQNYREHSREFSRCYGEGELECFRRFGLIKLSAMERNILGRKAAGIITTVRTPSLHAPEMKGFIGSMYVRLATTVADHSMQVEYVRPPEPRTPAYLASSTSP